MANKAHKPTNTTRPGRHQAFVLALMSDANRNATAAFKAIGFKGTEGAARVGAHKLLRDPRVQALIAQHDASALQVLEQAKERAGVSLERTLKSLAIGAHADPRRLFHEDGSPKAPHELDDDIAQAIEGIEITKIGDVLRYKYRLSPRAAHRDMLMKHLGGYREDNEQKADALALLLGSMRRSALPVVERVPDDELV